MRAFIPAGALMMALLTTHVEAHAFLDHAMPKVGSTVKVAPAEVRLWFSEKLEPALSKVQVLDSDGKPVPKQTQSADGKDASVLIATFPLLKPGKYKTVWRAVSVDTHVTKGDFSFTVSP